MKNMKKSLPALGAAVLLTLGCGDGTPAEGVVARAGDYVLTVDQTVDLLVDQEDLEAQAGVARLLSDLWIDYTLLADAALDDTTFSQVNVSELVMPAT